MTQKLCFLCREAAEFYQHGGISGGPTMKLARVPVDQAGEGDWEQDIPKMLDEMQRGVRDIKQHWSRGGYSLPMLAEEADAEGRPVCGQRWHPHQDDEAQLNW